MSRAEQMGDALRLAGRAAAYHRIFLGELIPHPSAPEELWHRRHSYYEMPALRVSSRLAGLAQRAVHVAILGTDDEYGAVAEQQSPAEIRRQAEALARQLETGAMVLEAVMRPPHEGAIFGAAEAVDRVFGFDQAGVS